MSSPSSKYSGRTGLREIPSTPGIYALLILLREKVRVKIRQRERTVAPGLYVYIGSAQGPGGLRARIARHVRRSKRIKWHVDQLTVNGEVAAIVYSIGRSRECVLTRPLEENGFTHPIRGFGSSDCTSGCTSHLLRFEGGKVECLRRLYLAFEAAGLSPALAEP